jgi:arylsulfatase A-like enzyme
MADAPRRRRSLRSGEQGLVAVLTAAFASIAFALVPSLLEGRRIVPSYLAFASALTLVSALAVAAASWPFGPAARMGLAGWAALSAGLTFGPPVGGLFGLVVLALLQSDERGRPGAVGSALCVSVALAVALLGAPRALGALGLATRHPATIVSALAGTGLVLFLGVRTVRLLQARPGVSIATAAVIAGTLAMLATVLRPVTRATDLAQAPDARISQLPTVILIVLDTVAAHRLSIYGYSRATTPELAAFLDGNDRAVLYPRAYAPSTWTLPSHASLFSGLRSSEHGIHRGSMYRDGQLVSNELRASRTLAEVLRERGYRTAAFFANDWLRYVRGFERGFDVFVHVKGPGTLPMVGEEWRSRRLPSRFANETSRTARAPRMNQEVLDHLDRSCRGGACFVFVNYMDAHAPYAPPRGIAGTFTESDLLGPPEARDSEAELAELAARHDEEIRGLDAALGQLLRQLERRRILDDSWLVITADHGEGFGEHGACEHGTSLHSEQTWIPLLILPPAPIRLPEQIGAVGLLDVTATLALQAGGGTLGVGRDLRERWSTPRPVGMLLHDGYLPANPSVPAARAVVFGRHKLLEIGSRQELYDVKSDPLEQHDIAARQREQVLELSHLLPALSDGGDAQQEPLPVSAEQREALRALGYLE